MPRFRAAAARRPSVDDLLARVADGGIVAALFVAPLWLGGRHDLGRLLYALAASAAAIGAVGWAARRGSGLGVGRGVWALVAAAAALLTLQATPLPPALLAWLAPHLDATLPLWGGDAGSLGVWRTVSVTPGETREGLALLACHAMVFLAVAARLRDADGVRRLLAWIGWAAAGMAALALVQHAVGNGKLLGVYDHPHREFTAVQGVFSNRNHFAHLMALGVGPLLYAVLRRRAEASRRREGDRRRLVQAALLALTVVAAMASQSRGGFAAIGVASIVAGAIAWRAGALAGSRALGLAVVVLLGIGGVSLLDYDRVANRLDDLASGDVETLDVHGARRAIWAANVAAWRSSPLVGYGAGSHRDVYPLFLDEPFSKEFTHAESGYLQVASETGLVGVALLVVAMASVAGWVLLGVATDRDPDRQLLWIGVAPGLAASATHAVVDFVWYAPGLLAITAALAAAAMRLQRFGRGDAATAVRSHRPARPAARGGLVGVGVATLAAAVAVGTLLPPARGSLAWDRYLRVSRSLRQMTQRIEDSPESSGADAAEGLMVNTAHAAELLQRVVRADPANARAHARLAGRLLQLFELESARCENGMAVELIRGAAVDGGFADHRAMLAWLERAFGERGRLLRLAHAHARRAAELAPLGGESYLYLAGLSFLEEGGPAPDRLVAQALAVRPHDGEVLFEAGRQRQLAGDAEGATELWRGCACRPGGHRTRLVAMLAGAVPAAAFLDALRPDQDVVRCALRRYSEVGTEDDLRALAGYASDKANEAEAGGEENPTRLAARWALVSRTLRGVGDSGAAVEAARRAGELAPHAFWCRLELAWALRAAERFDDADPHIRWCLARRPDIRYLHDWLAESAKRRTRVDINRRDRLRLYEELAGRPSDDEPNPPTDRR